MEYLINNYLTKIISLYSNMSSETYEDNNNIKNTFFYNYYYVKELFILLILLFIFIKHNKSRLVIIIFICILLFFYRNNYIHIRTKEYFISPSNSKITDISYDENENIVISTHLSPFDQHFMITPCDSEIIKIERIINERYADNLTITFKTIINNNTYLYKLEQIVNHIGNWGYIPSIIYKHRCITFMKEGDKLLQGERYGLIRFGSCMKYTIPKNIIQKNMNIKKGNYLNIGDTLFLL